MDLDEWELLSDDEFLQIHDDGRRIRRYGSNPIDYMTNNYFLSPSHKFPDQIPPAKQIVDDLRPIQVEEEMGVVVNTQVSFKKLMMMKENEFVDIKMDSPKSSRTGFPEIDLDFKKKKSEDEEKEEEEVREDEDGDGGRRKKIWKWSSFGVAAATFLFIVLANVNGNQVHGERKKMKMKKREKRNQKRRIKEVNEDMGRAADIRVG